MGKPMKDRGAAIVGVYTTKQGKRLGRSGNDLAFEAFGGALDDAGLEMSDVDGFFDLHLHAGNDLGPSPGNVAKTFGQPFGVVGSYSGAQGILAAASALSQGLAHTVALVSGHQQPIRDPASTKVSSYTTPAYEFTNFTGSFTAAQMALQLRRHMHEYGTTLEQIGEACAIVRNAGHVNPGAVMFGRGPYTAQDILAGPPMADPLTLLMCSLVNDGGNAIIMTTADRARDCRKLPIWVLGGAQEQRFRSWYDVPTLEPLQTRPRMVQAFRDAGVDRDDVDLVSLYDHFANGVILELEAMGFCEIGEGGPFVLERAGFERGLPLSTDGGCLAYSHAVNPYNLRPIEAVRQLRNEVEDLCPEWADGRHTYDRALCRKVADPRIAAVAGPMTGVFSFCLLGVDAPVGE
jgi:acetyl-CoA acetyltransferase